MRWWSVCCVVKQLAVGRVMDGRRWRARNSAAAGWATRARFGRIAARWWPPNPFGLLHHHHISSNSQHNSVVPWDLSNPTFPFVRTTNRLFASAFSRRFFRLCPTLLTRWSSTSLSPQKINEPMLNAANASFERIWILKGIFWIWAILRLTIVSMLNG